jgi:hypothetical protein
MSVTTIEIVLELDAADCPAGTVAAVGGEPHRFHGWIELVSTIGALSQPDGHIAGVGPNAPTPTIQGEPR